MLSLVSGSVGKLEYASWQSRVHAIGIHINILICSENLTVEMAQSRPTGGAAARSAVGRTIRGENRANTCKCYKYYLRRVPAYATTRHSDVDNDTPHSL